MKAFGWIIVGLLAIEVIGIAQLLLRGGGKEADAWFFFLTLPLALIVLALAYLILGAVLKK
jgi:hypothetical protein